MQKLKKIKEKEKRESCDRNCQKLLLIDVFKARYSYVSLPKLLFSL